MKIFEWQNTVAHLHWMALGVTNTVSHLYWIVLCLQLLVTSFIETERPELRDLCRYVLPLYAAHWWEIGIFLNIKPGQLEVIKSDNPADANRCCSVLFIKWLQGTGNITWEKMFEAIDLATVSFSIGNVGTTTTTTTATTSKFYVRILLELYCKLHSTHSSSNS